MFDPYIAPTAITLLFALIYACCMAQIDGEQP